MKFSTAAALLAAPFLVAAQTTTKCNPTKKSCPPDPALGGTASFDLTKGAPDRFTASGPIKYGKDGASMTVSKSGDGPTLISNFYIMFGSVEVELKAAPGQGMVSSFFLLSDCLDEIDYEWIGSDAGRVQSNYFGKGVTGDYGRASFHDNPGSQEKFHKYSFDWTSEKIEWKIDGKVVRTLTPKDAGDQYPSTPMYLRIGPWAGGDPSAEEGTREWAGGPINYNDGPFTMTVKSIGMTDYSTGSEYSYSDQSGSWKSIKSKGGKINPDGKPGSGPEGSPQTG